MGPSAGARLYSIAVHVLAIVGAVSLIALGLRLGAQGSGSPAVRHAPIQALAMISTAPGAGPRLVASHADGLALKSRPSRIAAKPAARTASVQSQPLLPALGPDVDVVFNEPLGQAPAHGTAGTPKLATDEEPPSPRREAAPNGEEHERPRLTGVQAANEPDPRSAQDSGAVRPLLVLVEAGQGPRADQPLLPNFSASATALPDIDRSADDPPTEDSKDATARDDSASQGADSAGDLARPNLDAQDGSGR